MSAFEWELDQQNKVTFVMIDGSGNEVSGLDGALTIEISKNGGSFAAATGAQSEIGSGWYAYTSTAGEADTPGPVSIRVTGAGAIQQNLEYVIKARNINGVEFTYTVTDIVTSLPISGAIVTITSDIAGTHVIFTGVTDTFGVARHTVTDELPFLDPGTYYFSTRKPGYPFTVPDTEVVS